MTSTTKDTRTLTLTLEVKIHHNARLDYENYKTKIVREFFNETDEEFEARCKKQWERLVEKYGDGGVVELEQVETDYDYCDVLDEILNTTDIEDELLVGICKACRKDLDHKSEYVKVCRQCFQDGKQ